MREGAIALHNKTDNNIDLDESLIQLWINKSVIEHELSMGEINFIFVNDDELLEINKKYLNHDYYTDVISFPLSDNLVEGDIYISVDRVVENAIKFNQEFKKELLRVMIHGVLHFLGQDDKDDVSKEIMRKKENECLDLFFTLEQKRN